MMDALELAAAGDSFERALDGGLDVGGEGEILDGAARRADEVMVVFGEILGELVTGELATAVDSPDYARLLEQGEVAVGGALRKALARSEQLGDRHGSIGGRKHGDDGSSVRRVAQDSGSISRSPATA